MDGHSLIRILLAVVSMIHLCGCVSHINTLTFIWDVKKDFREGQLRYGQICKGYEGRAKELNKKFVFSECMLDPYQDEYEAFKK